MIDDSNSSDHAGKESTSVSGIKNKKHRWCSWKVMRYAIKKSYHGYLMLNSYTDCLFYETHRSDLEYFLHAERWLQRVDTSTEVSLQEQHTTVWWHSWHCYGMVLFVRSRKGAKMKRSCHAFPAKHQPKNAENVCRRNIQPLGWVQRSCEPL